MKIYLDNNLGVTNVEQEELTQDTIGYNILKVYIPNAVLTPYNVFTCYYGALLQNGRKVGWFAMEARTSSDADYKANYTLYKATLEQCVVSVEGKVYIGCQVLLGNSGNTTLIKKNTAVVQFNVRKSVAINNDILVLDTDQTTTDVLESYKNLLKNALTTYATKAEIYTQAQINALLLAKADKSDTYTKTEVDGKLDLKADKSDTYTKAQVDSATLNLAGQIAGARLELNNKINNTNTQLGITDGKVTTLQDDVSTLQDDFADLKSVQNVVDVVATKSALNSYDTTNIEANDKIQVIADETHDGASTIYNWNGSAWVYVGAFGGNSYTKAETYNKTQIDSALRDKADKSDTYTKTEIDNTLQGVGEIFEIFENEIIKKADKTELNDKITELKWELGSHTLDVTTDTDTKYLKSVPSGAIGCQISKVGGMSYKCDNLINYKDINSSKFTDLGNDSFKLDWRGEVSTITLPYSSFKTNTQYSFTLTSLNGAKYWAYNMQWNYSDGTSERFTNNQGLDYGTYSYTSAAGKTVSSITWMINFEGTFKDLMLTFKDLMLNVGTYFDGIRDSAVTSVVSKDSNNTTIDTLTIPSEIQNLTGYGWGINDIHYNYGTFYNYIDFANKKFVQKVGRVDLGSLNYERTQWGQNYVFQSTISDMAKTPRNNVNVLTDKYTTVSENYLYGNVTDKVIANNTGSNMNLKIVDNTYTDAQTFTTAMNGVYLYYELATPIETDISAYLTRDTIDVEPNGTLEFTNTYSQDVPSDIDYLIEEVKA